MFDNLSNLPVDPLLGLILKYRADSNPNKIDLGVGVYKDELGNTPVLRAVKLAEEYLLNTEETKSYIGPLGDIEFSRLMGELIFGSARYDSIQSRLAVLQTPGGCGALRVGAELIMRAQKSPVIWASSPTWANHIPLLSSAGLQINSYYYYDSVSHTVDFDALLSDLEKAKPSDLVLLHGCCHNPSGADFTQEQWHSLCELMLERSLIPFVDIAYLGFAEGIHQDSYGARLIAEKFEQALFAVSCSKSFGLYRERVGAIMVLNKHTANTEASMSHLTNIVRGIYSMPPSHGAAIVREILRSSELTSIWQDEVNTKRERILAMRKGIVTGLKSEGFGEIFDFIGRQKGMFSFLGVSAEHVSMLANDFGIYMADTSRMSIAGLTEQNLPYFCAAVSSVLKEKV